MKEGCVNLLKEVSQERTKNNLKKELQSIKTTIRFVIKTKEKTTLNVYLYV